MPGGRRGWRRTERSIPLAEQDRARWDRALIGEGSALVEQTLATTKALGPYQLQAAIAAVHDEAASLADTDWAEILGLYELLAQVSPGPMVSLGRAVAVAMVHGPAAGLAAADELAGALARHHRFHAVRGHLLEMAGEPAAAADAYATAARYATNAAEKRYLGRQSQRVRESPLGGGAGSPREPAGRNHPARVGRRTATRGSLGGVAGYRPSPARRSRGTWPEQLR